MWLQRLGVTFLESKHCRSPPAIWYGKHWWEQPPGVMENSLKINQHILQFWSCKVFKLTGNWQTCFRVASAAAQDPMKLSEHSQSEGRLWNSHRSLQIQISVQWLKLCFCCLPTNSANSVQRVKILSICYAFKLQMFPDRWNDVVNIFFKI